jgi:hypothetical protein
VIGSAVLYCGLALALAGLVAAVKRPARGLAMVGIGLVVAVAGALAPAPAHRARLDGPRSRLDELMPEWEFAEHHERRVSAPPERVYEAIGRVRADEILFFRALTWIRRGGRSAPESILNAGDSAAIIDVATRSGFVRLADEPPRELVLGTVVVRPRGSRQRPTAATFARGLPPGFAVAAMNFMVVPDGAGGSRVSTETRVHATGDRARRRFGVYWRTIYPGSAIIRRMWLRAVARRAEGASSRS